MLYGMYLSATGMAMNQNQQDVIANNLANVNTTGFKRDLSVFQERLQEARGANRAFVPQNLKEFTGGAFVADVQTDFTPGAIENTNGNLDVALEGQGFLMVHDGQDVRYTRDGRFGLAAGRLVRQSDGKPVLDSNKQEITLPGVSAQDIQINSKGELLVKGQPVAELGIVNFENPQNLRKIGGTLYDANGMEAQAAETQVIPGYIESSTVNPASELVSMITASRTFQMNAELLSLQDQTLGKLVNELPKV